MPSSAIYPSVVMHQRIKQVRHRFVYRVFSLLFDLGELPELSRRLKLLKHNRAGILSFHDKDHGPRDGSPLRPWIEGELARAGIDLEGGPVRLLCYPRVFGYVFNPITVWYCHHRSGELRAVLYEVHNTYEEEHSYLVPIAPGADADTVHRHDCDKRFYVSPYIDVRGTYHFRIKAPDARMMLAIRLTDGGGDVMTATQTGERHEMTDRNLLSALIRHPLLTFKVVTAIHFEAVRLWLKGVRQKPRPAAPRPTVTIVDMTNANIQDGMRGVHPATSN